LDKDREVNAKLLNYVKGSVAVDIDLTDGNNKEESDKFDITPEGIKIQIEGVYLNQHVDSFISVKERAKFYEK
jgi:hypothetical protein